MGASKTLDEKRFKELTARISQKYDSQIEGCHVISEKSNEDTLGNADSRRHQTLGSIKSEKDSKGDASQIELGGRKVIGQAQGQGSGLALNPNEAAQSKPIMQLSSIEELPKAEEQAIDTKKKEKNMHK